MQGTAGANEDHLRYGWNYAMLLDRGPRPEALVPSPVLTAMRTGRLVRIEEITRCLPEVQDALISVLSERRMMIPELVGPEGSVFAAPGFNVIATANLRDRGVSEMSAALKRRVNFETVVPIAHASDENAPRRRPAPGGARLRRAGIQRDRDRQSPRSRRVGNVRGPQAAVEFRDRDADRRRERRDRARSPPGPRGAERIGDRRRGRSATARHLGDDVP